MIDVWGADHGGYVKRMKAAVSAITEGKGELDVKLCQLVRVMRNGELVRMSKRAGTFVTLRDLLDEVGPDVVRFTMLTRKNDAPFDFDLAKATEQSRDNPVWYVQYGHARSRTVSCGRRAPPASRSMDWTALHSIVWATPANCALVRLIAQWPRQVEAAAAAHEPHRIAFYLYELAAAFHAHWTRGRDEPGAALRGRGRRRAHAGASGVGTGDRFCDRIGFKGLRRNTRRRDEIRKNAHPPVPLRRRSKDLPAERVGSVRTARSAGAARRARTRFHSAAAAGFPADAGQPTAWPDPHRHGLDRRHRELRLGRVVGAQPGCEGGRPGARTPGRPGAGDADPGQARECRRAHRPEPGQGSLQPPAAQHRAGPAREAAARFDHAQAAGGRDPADAGGAQAARRRGREQDPDAACRPRRRPR